MGFSFYCWFRFLKSLSKHTIFDLGLGSAKDGDPHSESFATSSNPSITKPPTTLLNIYLFTLGTGYGRNQIGFEYSFKLNSTGSVFRMPSVPSNNSSKICNNFKNSLRCVVVKCWHWFSITLLKSDFSYLAYDIKLNRCVSVRICYDTYISLT